MSQACILDSNDLMPLHSCLQYLDGKKDWKLSGPWKKTLSTQLKNLSSQGKLVKVKSSYKLSDAFKKGPPKKKVCLQLQLLALSDACRYAQHAALQALLSKCLAV